MILSLDYDSRMEIELLKKDVSAIANLCEKFDATIEKMQEIAVSLSKMVSLHEQRLESQEESNREVQSILEIRRIEHNGDVKELHSRITTVHRELSDRIEATEKTILSEIHKLKEDLKQDKSTLGSRLSEIEVWKYTVIGAVLVVAWFIAQSDLLKLFTKH